MFQAVEEKREKEWWGEVGIFLGSPVSASEEKRGVAVLFQ